MKIAAVALADKGHQLGSIAHAAAGETNAGRNVAAQGNDMAHAHAFVFVQQRGHFVAAHADAGQVRCRRRAFGKHVADGLQRAAARRTAGAGRAGKERGLKLPELAAGQHLLFAPFGRAGGEEFKTEFFLWKHGRTLQKTPAAKKAAT